MHGTRLLHRRGRRHELVGRIDELVIHEREHGGLMRRVILLCAMVGCGDDGSALGADGIDEYDDDDLPAGSCRGTDSGTDTDPCDTEGTTVGAAPGAGDAVPDTDACIASADCSGGVCAAAFDPATIQRGPLACQFACIPLLDDAMWCSDDASCCDRGAVCAARGYCVLLDDGSSTSTGTSTE
jgi:hypothetical protein